jgi:hypothetical protein
LPPRRCAGWLRPRLSQPRYSSVKSFAPRLPTPRQTDRCSACWCGLQVRAG